VDVDSVRIQPNEDLSIDVDNGTIQLTSQIYPWNATENGVVWSSSNPEVAEVDIFGEVKAMYNGIAFIFATTTDGGYFDSVEVNVTNQRYEVTGITLNTATGIRAINTPGGTLQIIAIVEPENAEDKSVTWSVDDTLKATIDASGLLTAKSNGRVVVTCITNDGGLTATISITISGQPNDVIDLSLAYLKVYPIPTNDAIYIENNSPVMLYEILNLEGKVLKAIRNPELKCMIDIKELEPGLYLLRAQTRTNTRIVRIVK
jgi:uncharacterized protein YjdB